MIATVNKIGLLSQHILRQKPRQIMTMTNQPDIMITPELYTKAFEGINSRSGIAGKFNIPYYKPVVIEDENCTHEVFGCGIVNAIGYRLDYIQWNCTGPDGEELESDFSEKEFKQYF